MIAEKEKNVVDTKKINSIPVASMSYRHKEVVSNGHSIEDNDSLDLHSAVYDA